MRRAVAIAAVVLVATAARVAIAGSCHGGGGGGGGGVSSSGGGGGGVSSSGGGGASSACVDGTDIVGRKQCTGFGAGWSTAGVMPPIDLELGWITRSFGGGVDAPGQTTHGDQTFGYRLVGGGDGATPERIVTTGVELRGTFGLGPYLYLGGEIEGAGAVAGPAIAARTAMIDPTRVTPTYTRRGTAMLGYAGVAGARAPLGGLVVSAELVAGGATFVYDVESRFGECESTSSVDVTRARVEARIRAEAWLGPWATVGIAAGTDLLDSRGASFTVFVAGHSRAFGSLR